MKRRIVAIALCLAAVGGGSVAGAVVKKQIYVVRAGEQARLAGTGIYCRAYVKRVNPGRGQPAFDCAWWGKTRRVPGSYLVDIGAWGVLVEKWRAAGDDYDVVGTYLNP